MTIRYQNNSSDGDKIGENYIQIGNINYGHMKTYNKFMTLSIDQLNFRQNQTLLDYMLYINMVEYMLIWTLIGIKILINF